MRRAQLLPLVLLLLAGGASVLVHLLWIVHEDEGRSQVQDQSRSQPQTELPAKQRGEDALAAQRRRVRLQLEQAEEGEQQQQQQQYEEEEEEEEEQGEEETELGTPSAFAPGSLSLSSDDAANACAAANNRTTDSNFVRHNFRVYVSQLTHMAMIRSLKVSSTTTWHIFRRELEGVICKIDDSTWMAWQRRNEGALSREKGSTPCTLKHLDVLAPASKSGSGRPPLFLYAVRDPVSRFISAIRMLIMYVFRWTRGVVMREDYNEALRWVASEQTPREQDLLEFVRNSKFPIALPMFEEFNSLFVSSLGTVVSGLREFRVEKGIVNATGRDVQRSLRHVIAKNKLELSAHFVALAEGLLRFLEEAQGDLLLQGHGPHGWNDVPRVFRDIHVAPQMLSVNAFMEMQQHMGWSRGSNGTGPLVMHHVWPLDKLYPSLTKVALERLKEAGVLRDPSAVAEKKATILRMSKTTHNMQSSEVGLDYAKFLPRTWHTMCKYLADDYCCFNLPLPKQCEGMVRCTWIQNRGASAGWGRPVPGKGWIRAEIVAEL